VARRLSLILAMLLVLNLCGCSDLPQSVTHPAEDTTTPQEENASAPLQMALAYSHDDTLNPFAATTEVNSQLTGLLYESLMVLDENFIPQLGLAASVEQPDATHLTVTLRKGAVFSDGSKVTPEDVVTSFQEAKKTDRYRALLSNVTTAKKEGSRVQFALVSADPNARACLTFPVVKGSTLTDKPAKAPLGSGVYKLKTTDSGLALVQNKRHPESPAFQEITLCHLPTNTARQHALASGEITYYYDDLSEGDTPRITGASRKVDTTTLVFVGLNGNRGKLKTAVVRRALSLMLDRTALTQAAYGEWAMASAAPVHPRWDWMSQVDTTADRDLDGATTLLEQAGCPSKEGKRLTLELIYVVTRSDRTRMAEQLRTQAKKAGVILTLVPLSEKEYRSRLKSGKYDLYLGESRLTADMSLRPWLAGGSTSYGVSRSGPAAKAYARYLKEELSLEKLMTVFAEETPYIPLCWRYGVAGFTRRLTVVTPTGQDPYAGVAQWQ